MIKRILSIICLLFLSSNLAYGISIYSDVKEDNLYYPILLKLHKEGVMVGVGGNVFDMNAPVTREDYSRVITKALKLDNKFVMSGIDFSDLSEKDLNYDDIQITIYYNFLPLDNSGKVYPNKPILRKDIIIPVSEYLNNKCISETQAKFVLAKYEDTNSLKVKDLVKYGKAEVMGLIPVSDNVLKINPNEPMKRIDLAIMAYNIMVGKTEVYEEKIEQVKSKKKAEGFVIKEAYVVGDCGIIPANTIIPVKLKTVVDSQTSKLNDKVQLRAYQNLITKDGDILFKDGTLINIEITDIQKRKCFIRNGKLKLEGVDIVTPNKQCVKFKGVLILDDKIGLGNKIFKCKRVKTTTDKLYGLKFLEEIKIDITTGMIVE